MPERVIASSTGKNSRNTGTIIVPRPKPEKKVSKEEKRAMTGMRYSIKLTAKYNQLFK